MFSVLHIFFSSRRRHTRSKRDWSSDVCSSDLEVLLRTAAMYGGDYVKAYTLAHCDRRGKYNVVAEGEALAELVVSAGRDRKSVGEGKSEEIGDRSGM